MRYLPRRITWRGAFVAAALVEAAAAVGVVGYLAATGRVLTVAVRAPEGVDVREDGRLAVPVAGVRREDLRGSFGAPRSGGRAHLGIDIMAPEGTPVVAAASGVIVKRDSSALGGIDLYERGMDGVTIYFYAHLRGYRAGLKEGDLVRRGDTLAYVGQTGNAPVPHLHFGVYTVTDPNRWWHGRDVDPYPILSAPARRSR